jgi:hypothetical protein
MQIKTEQIDEYPAPSVDPTAAVAAELDVAKEVLVSQAGRLQVHEQHARILQANYDRLMAFVGEQVGQLRGVAGEFELRAEKVREAVAARDGPVATDRATAVAAAWESQIHDKYAKILQANNVRLVSFVGDLRDQLRVVASELELRVAGVKAALAVKDKAGARDPSVKWYAEDRAAKEASLFRSLQSAEIEHAEMMKAAEAAHAESLKGLNDRLRAVEEAHDRQIKAAEAAHAESLKALNDRMLAAEQVHDDKLKGVEHAYAYNIKAVAHINAERLEALDKAHAETVKILQEKLSAEKKAHAETLEAFTKQLSAAEEAHAETVKELEEKLSAEEKRHAITFKVVTDLVEKAHAEERGTEPRPRRRQEEDVIDALSKTFEFAPPFSSLDECRKSGFLAKPGFINQVLADLKKQGSLKGLTNTGLLVRLEQRGYPRVPFEARAGKQPKSWVVGVRKRMAPRPVRELDNNESKVHRRPCKRERQAQRLMALDDAHSESIMPHAEGLLALEEAHAESLRARDAAHAESLRGRDAAHAESLRARDAAHAATEAALTEKLRIAEEAVKTKGAVLKRLFHASRGLLEVHLGTLMEPEAVASCMAMTEPSKDRSGGKRKRLEFSNPENCIEGIAPKLIEGIAPKLIEGIAPKLIEGRNSQKAIKCDALFPYDQDIQPSCVAHCTRRRTVVPPV